jgi:hypothetical protein
LVVAVLPGVVLVEVLAGVVPAEAVPPGAVGVVDDGADPAAGELDASVVAVVAGGGGSVA